MVYGDTVAPDPRIQDDSDEPQPRRKEEGCFAITEQRKYYELQSVSGGVFVKRNLTPSEYRYLPNGKLLDPCQPHLKARLQNEAAALKWVQAHTTIPVSNLLCAFEDRGRFYVITAIVPGVAMSELPSDEAKAIVQKELEGYITQMHKMKSKTMGGFAGVACLPYRLEEPMASQQPLKFREAPSLDQSTFVLCHNDLSQHNVIVDPTTLKINAILDWEYAGFYPKEVDGLFYTRSGPSVALGEEKDDVSALMKLIEGWKSEP